jgi:hypothetical protein
MERKRSSLRLPRSLPSPAILRGARHCGRAGLADTPKSADDSRDIASRRLNSGCRCSSP